jgi:opacity protein-like surface antigen
MRRYSCLAIAAVAVFTFNNGSAAAQTLATGKAAATVTPFVSLGSPFSSRVGAAILFPWTDKVGLEAEVGYRREEMNAVSAHLSVIQDLTRIGRVTPYVAAGVGLEQYGTPVQQPNNSLATMARTALSVNAGGGVKVPVDDRWGVRADARWFNGLGEQAGEHWRLFNGVTWKAGRR